jgi:hypothetical protein
MARRTEPYTLEEVPVFINKAARLLGRRYAHWGVDLDDIFQELRLWALVPKNQERIVKWLASDPQQTTRIFRSLYDHGLSYCEKEKANRVGYAADDVAWYSPALVATLLPFALDSEWDGMVSEDDPEKAAVGVKVVNDELLTMVMDVRQAMNRSATQDILLQFAPGDDEFETAIQQVVDALGGQRQYVGRRKANSNSKARYLTDGDVA